MLTRWCGCSFHMFCRSFPERADSSSLFCAHAHNITHTQRFKERTGLHMQRPAGLLIPPGKPASHFAPTDPPCTVHNNSHRKLFHSHCIRRHPRCQDQGQSERSVHANKPPNRKAQHTIPKVVNSPWAEANHPANYNHQKPLDWQQKADSCLAARSTWQGGSNKQKAMFTAHIDAQWLQG